MRANNSIGMIMNLEFANRQNILMDLDMNQWKAMNTCYHRILQCLEDHLTKTQQSYLLYLIKIN